MKTSIVLALFTAFALAVPGQAPAVEEEAAVVEDAAVASGIRGCRSVDVVRIGRTPQGRVAYRFHHVKRWCWAHPYVTSVSSSVYVTDVDPSYAFRGVVGASGGYFPWCCGIATSGHSSVRQGRFDALHDPGRDLPSPRASLGADRGSRRRHVHVPDGDRLSRPRWASARTPTSADALLAERAADYEPAPNGMALLYVYVRCCCSCGR